MLRTLRESCLFDIAVDETVADRSAVVAQLLQGNPVDHLKASCALLRVILTVVQTLLFLTLLSVFLLCLFFLRFVLFFVCLSMCALLVLLVSGLVCSLFLCLLLDSFALFCCLLCLISSGFGMTA